MIRHPNVQRYQEANAHDDDHHRASQLNSSADNGCENNGLSYSEMVEYGGGGESGPSSSRCDDDVEYFGDTYSMDNGENGDSRGDLNTLYGQSSAEVIGFGAEYVTVESYVGLPDSADQIESNVGLPQSVDQSEFVSLMPTEAPEAVTNVEDAVVSKNDSMCSTVTATTDITVRKGSRKRSVKKTKPKKLSAAALKKARFAHYFVGAADDDNNTDK